MNSGSTHVMIAGGGFGGLACARNLAKHPDVRVTLIDKHNYRQFQPLLYQLDIGASGWFAAWPSGTENMHKIYCESFWSEAHLEAIVAEAREIVNHARIN